MKDVVEDGTYDQRIAELKAENERLRNKANRGASTLLIAVKKGHHAHGAN